MQRPIQNLRCMSALVICSALSACIPTVRSPVSNIPQSAAPPPRLPVDLVTQMEPEPVWNARQVVPNARTIPESSYIVSPGDTLRGVGNRSEEHTSELQSLMRISYAVFCLKKK